ncbi:trace amine-associated receptor 13c-like [Acipenser ruthenus]|uniref:trace amine-associated receptor 13c-like n=1 Tax=Acipenser ruthenus TaxID=7906 RepID=UPI00145A737A|nr:trace amine-associated receptor 13c-like [Acipenser ruthenus]
MDLNSTGLIELQVQYCFQSGNASCPKEIHPTAIRVTLYIFWTGIVMLTVCGNLVVIISISHFKQLHTPTNLFLLSLAVADFLIGVFVMPFTMIQYIETCWYFGDILCSIYTMFILVLTSVSISNLVFIAVDRYFVVCNPFIYSTKITIPLTWMFIALSWMLSVVYTYLLFYFKGNINDVEGIDPCLGDCFLEFNATWTVVDLIVTFLLPCSTMVTVYTKVFIVAKRHARVINAIARQISSADGNKSNIPKRSERKATKTLGIVVAVFLLCWVPYYISTVVDAYINFSVPPVVMGTLTWVVYFNSSMNPIIYALFYPWFQKSLKLILTFKIFSPASCMTNLFPENQ